MRSILRHSAIVAVLIAGLAAHTSRVQAQPVTPLAASTLAAGAYPSAVTLLRRSIAAMKHTVHQIHSDGVITTTACCPNTSTTANLTGDCAVQSNVTTMRFAVRGTMVFGPKTPVVPLDFHVILISNDTQHTAKSWTRSQATHNTWQKATRVNLPTHDTDLTVYLCPIIFSSVVAQVMPAHLVNLGPATVQGRSVWHLRDRFAPTTGGFKGTVMQTDFYLAQSSLHWLRFTSLYGSADFTQRVVTDYSRVNAPVTITAPTVGSSLP